MEEGGKEEMEREEGEEGGNPAAGGVPTWADIPGWTPTTPSRRHAGRQERGRSSKSISDPLLLQWQDERKEWALLFVLLSVCFFCLGVEWGEGEPWGASKGVLDHEDFLCPT
jgi:hypothetical protein